MNVDDLNQRAARIKADLSESMRALLKAKDEFKLSPPDKTFTATLENLGRTDYDVVVCGEVNQGKTSFINALLGQALLPTDVKVATSQVFRISKADSENFALVFDDGVREPITRDGLVKYGTETDEKLANDPLIRGRRLKWIEVNTPAAFLPAGVHLLDTPGLGALYHAHALITHTYVAAADAVIFIKSGDSPLVDTERSFLQKVFNVTTNVMFVQTKTDMLDEEARDALLKRNEKLVNREFEKAAHRHITFWPVSSKNLLSAAQMDDPAVRDMLKAVSGFDAMLDGLTVLFFLTTGHVGACAACQSGFQYYERTAAFLVEQRKILSTADEAERRKLTAANAKQQADFAAKWGPDGLEMRKINKMISDIVVSGQGMVLSVFSQGGKIRKYFVDEIDALPDDVDEVQKYGQTFGSRITDAVLTECRRIGSETQQELAQVMCRFTMALDLTAQGTFGAGDHKFDIKVDDESFYSKTRSVFGGATMGAMIGGVGTAALITAGVIASGGLAAALIPLVALFTGAVKGREDARRAKVKADKAHLKNSVASILSELHNGLTVAPQVGKKAQMQAFFDELKEKAACACRELYKNEKQKLADELRQLEEQSKSNVEQSKQKLAELSKLAGRLEPVKVKLLAVRDELVAINAELKF